MEAQRHASPACVSQQLLLLHAPPPPPSHCGLHTNHSGGGRWSSNSAKENQIKALRCIECFNADEEKGVVSPAGR